MQLQTLTKIKKVAKKRRGLGHGSGRGKTAGRGTKGQKARRNIPLRFEGGALPLIKRLPFQRGKGRNKPFKDLPLIVNVSALNLLPKNSTVDLESLIKHRIIRKADGKKTRVKILGDGELTVALTVNVPVSKGAAKKIEKAGGTIK